MPRKQWTLMQWHASLCKFVPKSLGDSPPPLPMRNRIPKIDKLMQVSYNPRPLEFLETLRKSPLRARELLESYANELEVDDLEQFVVELASRHSKGLDSIPPNIVCKLRKYGVLNEVQSQLMERRMHFKNEDQLVHTNPLTLLESQPDRSSTLLQRQLESSQFFSPGIRELYDRWTEELRNGVTSRSRGVKLANSISAYLPLTKQCELVAYELCLLTAANVNTPFPKPLTSVCLDLGYRLEHTLLINIKNSFRTREQTPASYVHNRSEFLWSVAKQPPWTVKTRMNIGAFWLQNALKLCRFTLEEKGLRLERPALWNTWYMSKFTKRGVLLVNSDLLKKLRIAIGDSGAITNVLPSQIPLLVPPRPWTSLQATNVPQSMRGLKLVTSSSLEGRAYVKAAINSEAALPQIRGLNRLQSQAWRINVPILNVLSIIGRALDKNNDSPNLQQQEPPNVDEEKLPPNNRESIVPIKKRSHPYGINSARGRPTPSIDWREVKASRAEKGLETQFQQAIAVARALGDRPFYLPMYMDFRGRCYASSNTQLNFMGNDSMRSLFLFAEPKPLGETGLEWLEIHLANLYGECKSVTFQARREWVAIHKPEIVECANNPLITEWWRKSSKPFQTLAACMELQKAWSSEDPRAYKCSLPIQIDGTSNGLQHLIALARDDANAHAVNLTSPLSLCSDVYTSVGNSIAEDLPRNAAKRAIMTFFYGASPSKLASIFKEEVNNSKLGAMMAKRLETLFAAERQVQHWFVECAKRICRACKAGQTVDGASLVWTSPLGLPVVQPYVDPKLMAIRTDLQSFFLESPFHLPQVVPRKQAAGVVANYIHSLDASHMLRTAEALSPDTSFSAVHDCFWTHASSVPVLNRVLRDTFVDIHERDLLAEVRDEWVTRYDGFMVQAYVHRGTPIYKQLKRDRNGVCKGPEQQAILDAELADIYNGRPCISTRYYSQCKPDDFHWKDGVPHYGSTDQPCVRIWIPLVIPDPPPRGSFDINEVKTAPYFFS